MDPPKFTWRTEEEWMAITWTDKEIYPHLKSESRGRLLADGPKDERCCRVHVDLSNTYDATTPGLCSRKDLEEFISKGLEKFTGPWSVFWHGESQRNSHEDEPYEDDFRGVVTFRNIEFSIRPTGEPNRPGFMPGLDIARLRIAPGDVKDCLTEILRHHPSTQNFSLRNLEGTGHAINPKERYMDYVVPHIPFAWRIAQLPQDRIDMYVHRWRHANCKQAGYAKLIQLYWKWYVEQPPETRKELGLRPPVFKPKASLRLYKRKSRRSSTSPEPVTSHKRQSQDFETRRTEQQVTAPRFGTSSSDAPRRPWAAYGLEGGPLAPPSAISRQHDRNYSPQAQTSTPPSLSQGNKITRSGHQGHPFNLNINPPLPAPQSPEPAPSATASGGPSSTSGVTRDMSSLSITATSYSYRHPVPTYQQRDHYYEQPDTYRFAAPPQRTYGDDISQAELDRSRGIGQLPEPIRYKPHLESGMGKQSNRAGESYQSQFPPQNERVFNRGQGLMQQEQHLSEFLTKGVRDYRPRQVMQPPAQASIQPQNRGKQNLPPPTKLLPGVESMLKGAPPLGTTPAPGKSLPSMSASHQGTSTGRHGASRYGSMASASPGTVNPEPPYQGPQDVSTGRGVGRPQESAFSRHGHQSGPQAAQELGRGLARGGGAHDGRDHSEGQLDGGLQGVFQPGNHSHLGRGGEARGGEAPSRS